MRNGRRADFSSRAVVPCEVLAVSELLERRAKAPPRAMQPAPSGHLRTAQNGGDLGRREALPLGQQQHLAIERAELMKRLADEVVIGITRGLVGDRGEREPLSQRRAALC